MTASEPTHQRRRCWCRDVGDRIAPSNASHSQKRPGENAGPFLISSCRFGSADDLVVGEEEGDFLGGGFRGVGTVHGVGFDRLGEFLADRAVGGIGRIGGAHDFAILRDGVLAFQHLHDDRAGDHEGDEVVEEGTLLVHGVEAFGLVLAQTDALLGDDAQTGFLDLGVDGAGQIAGGGVGLDDGEGALQRHGIRPRRLLGLSGQLPGLWDSRGL